MNKKRFDYIASIERRQPPRINTSSGFRLDMAERLFDYPDAFLKTFLSNLDQKIEGLHSSRTKNTFLNIFQGKGRPIQEQS